MPSPKVNLYDFFPDGYVIIFSLTNACIFRYMNITLFPILEEQSYMLRDAEAEVLFCFSLEESLKRAQVAPLFKVHYFPPLKMLWPNDSSF